jgi:hypothetical protein
MPDNPFRIRNLFTGLWRAIGVGRAKASAPRPSILDAQPDAAPPAVDETQRWGDDLLAPRSDIFAILSEAQVSFDSVIVLSEADVTKVNIDYALEWVDEREDADTEVLLYFSGHGGQITDTSVLPKSDGLNEPPKVFDTSNTPAQATQNLRYKTTEEAEEEAG